VLLFVRHQAALLWQADNAFDIRWADVPADVEKGGAALLALSR